MIFDKGAEARQLGVFNKWHSTIDIWHPTCEKKKERKKEYRIDLLNSQDCSKWMKDIYVKCKHIILLEDNIGENLDDFSMATDWVIS